MKPPFIDDVVAVLDQVRDMLVAKNRRYGNSVGTPVNIFSGLDAVEQLKCRIDDKLSRVKSAQLDEDEDTVLDLIGYLILLRVVQFRARR